MQRISPSYSDRPATLKISWTVGTKSIWPENNKQYRCTENVGEGNGRKEFILRTSIKLLTERHRDRQADKHIDKHIDFRADLERDIPIDSSTLAVLSSEDVMRCSPSCEKFTDRTTPVWPFIAMDSPFLYEQCREYNFEHNVRNQSCKVIILKNRFSLKFPAHVQSHSDHLE